MCYNAKNQLDQKGDKVPKIAVPLNDKQIQNAKPKDKNYYLMDGKGLYLIITPKGGKWWRFKYTFEAKQQTLSLGTYPIVSLLEAREKAAQLKKEIKQGINPLRQRREAKEIIKAQEAKNQNTFYNISQKWLESYESQVSPRYHIKISKLLALNVYNNSQITIKDTPIDEVTRKDIIAVLESINAKGNNETARRVSQHLGQIFKYAVTHEYLPHNIMSDIDKKVVLGKKIENNYPTLTKEQDIKKLLCLIDEYVGDFSTKMALRLLPYLFVRNSNIRQMEWQEIDFAKRVWSIPKEKMKTKEDFVLPLPVQAIDILLEVKEYGADDRLVFPSAIKRKQPISDNTLILALRRLGYSKDELVPHSFRSIFSTIAYEKANDKTNDNYTSEVIEALLAHKEPNKVKSAYNRSTYTEAMRGLIEWYANYLDGLKNS